MKAIIICGPTGSGKSAVGMTIAERYNGAIVSADSRQIYRRLDIGTAKPSMDDRRKIPHYMIDIVDVSEYYSAVKYSSEAKNNIELITASGRIPLLVGGTGLYLEALTEGIFQGPGMDEDIRAELTEEASGEGLGALYDQLKKIDPKDALSISPNDEVRIIRSLEIYRQTGLPPSAVKESSDYSKVEGDFLWIGLGMPRKILYSRINDRVDQMISAGLPGEIKELLADGLGKYIRKKKIVGYSEIIDAIEDQTDPEEAIDLVKRHSRNYAKRQMTWFRNRTESIWLNPLDDGFESKVFTLLDEHLKRT